MEKLTRRLNHIAMAGLLLVGLSTPSWADPVAPCAHDSLQDYINLGSTGCTIGNLRFFDFDYELLFASLADPVPPDNVAVHPISGPDKGFTFEGEWYSTGFGVLSQSLQYSVEDVGNKPSVVGADLSFEGYAGVAPVAQAQVQEHMCLGGVFVPIAACTGGTPSFLFVSTFTVSELGTGFLGTPFLSVFNIVNVNAGADGQAEVDAFTNTFSQVPEPGLLVLLGLGASGLVARRRRNSNA